MCNQTVNGSMEPALRRGSGSGWLRPNGRGAGRISRFLCGYTWGWKVGNLGVVEGDHGKERNGDRTRGNKDIKRTWVPKEKLL